MRIYPDLMLNIYLRWEARLSFAPVYAA